MSKYDVSDFIKCVFFAGVVGYIIIEGVKAFQVFL